MYGMTEIFVNWVLESLNPAAMDCSMKRCSLIFFFFVLICHLDCFLTGDIYTSISAEIEPWFMLYSVGNFLYFRHICLISFRCRSYQVFLWGIKREEPNSFFLSCECPSPEEEGRMEVRHMMTLVMWFG